MLFPLRDAFRASDVWLARSRRYGDIRKALLSAPAAGSGLDAARPPRRGRLQDEPNDSRCKDDDRNDDRSVDVDLELYSHGGPSFTPQGCTRRAVPSVLLQLQKKAAGVYAFRFGS